MCQPALADGSELPEDVGSNGSLSASGKRGERAVYLSGYAWKALTEGAAEPQRKACPYRVNAGPTTGTPESARSAPLRSSTIERRADASNGLARCHFAAGPARLDTWNARTRHPAPR